MHAPDTNSASSWRWRWAAILLILSVTILRLLYLAFVCPLDLVPDEAHYWEWSRNLDWSYYSKGPLVAYLIRLGCLVAGPLSTWLTGNEMAAVRLPAVLSGGLLLVSMYVLTVQVFGRDKLAFAVLLVALSSPILAAGGMLMTIDAPFCCCWGWALVLGFQAIFRGSAWSWPILGVVVGLGILAKYTMVLFPISLGLFLLATPRYRSLLVRPGFWIMATLSAICCLPILIWNVQNEWITFRHLSGHAGFSEDRGLAWRGPLKYLGGQCALLLGYFFLVWVHALVRYRPWKESRNEVGYLWWLSLPVFVFFLLFSWKNGGGQVNWPITAYFSGMILAVAWLADILRQPGRQRTLHLVGLSVTCCLSITLTILLHDSAIARPILERFCEPPSPYCPTPMRRLDPTCRLKGWRTLADFVDRLCEQCRRDGVEPVVVTARWTEAGELGFYCHGQPKVYSIGLALGDRHSQYDLWRPNPLADPQLFLGKTFIVVDSWVAPLEKAFDHLDAPQRVTHYEGGHPIAQWVVVVGRGFRGLRSAVEGKPHY